MKKHLLLIWRGGYGSYQHDALWWAEAIDGTLMKSSRPNYAFIHDMDFGHVLTNHLEPYINDPEWEVRIISKDELKDYRL